MSGKRSAPRNSSVPDYNIALLGEIGVGKSGKSKYHVRREETLI
jgi:hypothetical protein